MGGQQEELTDAKYGMRQWINLIEHQQVPQFLYHGTTLYNLVRIINEDAMACSEDDELTRGVFATPNYSRSRAKDYGDGVIVFDTAALMAKQPVVPNYYHATPDELEYVIQPDDDYLKNISSYIERIIVQKHDLEAIKAERFEREDQESDWSNAI